MLRISTRSGIAVFSMLMVAAPLSAQSGGADEQSSLTQSLYACRDIADNADRLGCFDREVAAIQQAEASQDLIIADRGQVREARRGLFGFKLPKLRLFGGGKDDDTGVEQIEQVEEPLARFGSNSMGKAYFQLESGARWIQTDNVPVLGNPKPGDIVVIREAALGSYSAKIDGRRAIKVRRVD